MFRQVLYSLCEQVRKVFLMRFEGKQWIYTLKLCIVGSDLLVKMQARNRATVVHAFLHDGDRSVIAGCFYGKRRQAPARTAASGEQTGPL